MGQFSSYVKSKNNVRNVLTELRNIIEELCEQGAELDSEIDKIYDALTNLENDRVNIALVGSFSDGKTTVVAGMLRRLSDDMKIDIDESSDEIAMYDVDGFEDTCVIIDTPGLFGDKILTGENEGKLYSELTKDYISRAHIILFVLDATNPLKDSHNETAEWILKDLNKKDETIFVINKMDEVADLTDAEDFREQDEIKKKVVYDRVRAILGISRELSNDLNVVCISANPNGRGLDFWLNREEIYLERSRIDDLSLSVEKILSNTSRL
jgi:predicted GTPase